MATQRMRKALIVKTSRRRRQAVLEEDLRLWDRSPPVGREFGSPDFERFMAEDHRDSVGVFDPAFRAPSAVAVVDDTRRAATAIGTVK